MYVVEYHRFYLRDLESIVVWPSRWWLLRLIIPGVLLAAIGAALWRWTNATAGAIFVGMAAAWVLLELALGPTAGSRVRATGVSIDLPLVQRTRRAERVLAAIDTAVRNSREVTAQPAGAWVQTNSEARSATPAIADASQTIGQ
jgi:hypothetical protein